MPVAPSKMTWSAWTANNMSLNKHASRSHLVYWLAFLIGMVALLGLCIGLKE